MARVEPDRKPLSWPTILFIVGTTVGAALWPLYAYFYGVTLGQVLLAVAYFVIAGMSITVGYHRLFSHRSFNCRPWMKAALLVTGSSAWQGSALDWAADHIRHHGYTDTEKDPYNIKQGVWHAHVGWLFRRTTDRPVPGFLTSDPLIVWQDKYYIPLAILTSFVVPYLIAGTGGLLLAGVVRIVVGHHVTWFVNSWAHLGGSRPYDPGCSAADNWVVALFTFGEGYHNYHHTFPNDYRNGITAWSWDPSKWVIQAFSFFGIAYDLKRVGPIARWQKRVQGAMADATADSKQLERLRKTRASLELQVEQTRERLERAIESGVDYEISARDNLSELRENLSKALQDKAEQVGSASRRKVERARELLDRMEAYGDLLDRMRKREAELAAT
jgi:stearoyl-CoA desaturase (delta-9 desaturase)